MQSAAPATAPPGIPLLLCMSKSSGRDSTKQAPNSRNSCSNESIRACRVTWPSTIASALALASGAGVPVAMSRVTMAPSRSRATSLYWVTLAIRSPRWIAVNRCTRVAETAIPTLPPSWRIRLKSPVPFGILLIGRSASARFVSGTKISPSPTPRKISGQKKSDIPLSVVKWACFHMDSAKIATPARIESRASNLPVVRPIVAIVNAPRLLLEPRVLDEAERQRQRQHADGDVDVEDPRPAERVGDVAAERRPQRRPHHHAHAEDRHRGAELLARKHFVQDRLRGGEQRAAPQPLDDPPEHQRDEGVRVTAEEG